MDELYQPLTAIPIWSLKLAGRDVVKAKEIWKHVEAVILDVDATLIQELSLFELVKFCGKEQEVSQLVKSSLSKDFIETLINCIELVRPSKAIIKEFNENHQLNFSPRAKDLVHFLQTKEIPIYLVSGSLKSLILPLAKSLKIPEENIFSNSLKFHTDGSYGGFHEGSMTKTYGKAEVANFLKKMYNYRNLVNIGDGLTDLEAAISTDAFIGYGGNIERKIVKDQAMWFITDFSQLMSIEVQSRATPVTLQNKIPSAQIKPQNEALMNPNFYLRDTKKAIEEQSSMLFTQSRKSSTSQCSTIGTTTETAAVKKSLLKKRKSSSRSSLEKPNSPTKKTSTGQDSMRNIAEDQKDNQKDNEEIKPKKIVSKTSPVHTGKKRQIEAEKREEEEEEKKSRAQLKPEVKDNKIKAQKKSSEVSDQSLASKNNSKVSSSFLKDSGNKISPVSSLNNKKIDEGDEEEMSSRRQDTARRQKETSERQKETSERQRETYEKQKETSEKQKDTSGKQEARQREKSLDSDDSDDEEEEQKVEPPKVDDGLDFLRQDSSSATQEEKRKRRLAERLEREILRENIFRRLSKSHTTASAKRIKSIESTGENESSNRGEDEDCEDKTSTKSATRNKSEDASIAESMQSTKRSLEDASEIRNKSKKEEEDQDDDRRKKIIKPKSRLSLKAIKQALSKKSVKEKREVEEDKSRMRESREEKIKVRESREENRRSVKGDKEIKDITRPKSKDRSKSKMSSKVKTNEESDSKISRRSSSRTNKPIISHRVKENDSKDFKVRTSSEISKTTSRRPEEKTHLSTEERSKLQPPRKSKVETYTRKVVKDNEVDSEDKLKGFRTLYAQKRT